MSHSAQKQRHEQARKKHKRERQQHAREAAKQPRSATPRRLLVGGIVVVAIFVLIVIFAT